MSFFVNAGVRFVEETAKLRAFGQLWSSLLRDRYGIADPKVRRFRYGVQVNSLGLTEAQPENNVARIVLEMLGVTLSRDARARAVQLPAWNEALGLPRPWDQQWSLRLQQVLAYESDLLEYGDIFHGSHVMTALTSSIVDGARAELDKVLDLGGVVAAVESGYLKSALVGSLAERRRRIENGDEVVVGVNRFTETEPSPLLAAGAAHVERVDPAVEVAAAVAVKQWRGGREAAVVSRALDDLRRAAASPSENLMDATLACARVGVTTGEWAGVLREVFGEYRPPTGLQGSTGVGSADPALRGVRARAGRTASELGRSRLRMLVGKPGLDGHSNGAEQIAVRARDAGFEVIYQGIRLTPAEVVAAAVAEDVDLVGLSILSGAHLDAVPAVLSGLRAAGAGDVPVVVGGIIPPADADALREAGVARVFTPKDFGLNQIVDDLVTVVRAAHGLTP
jgi:(2R)-ethylmalonyl-CoA mutase